MKISVLLDTSFLISLSDKNRPHHEIAKQYYQHMIEQNITMYLSSIAVSEFSIKQDIRDLPLKNFRILPFNFFDGIEAATISNLLGKIKNDDRREVAKDDLKLIAQALREKIPFVMTEDVRTFYKDCEKLKVHDKNITAIPLKDGFIPSQLRIDGQKDIEDIIN